MAYLAGRAVAFKLSPLACGISARSFNASLVDEVFGPSSAMRKHHAQLWRLRKNDVCGVSGENVAEHWVTKACRCDGGW